MNSTHFAKAALLTLILVSASLLSWEILVRQQGYETSYNDDPPLWSDKRQMVYEPSDKATVFIGSSRIKFDLDIPTWEKNTGDHAIQLACVGSNPLPILENLAVDEDFKGKLVIDVTEILFFSTEFPNMWRPRENLAFYQDRTPAQRASFVINHLLESQLALLDKDRLSMGAALSKLDLPKRRGVFVEPRFPDGFGRVKFNRQEYMTDEFVADTNATNHVKSMWALYGKMSKEPPASGEKLDSLFKTIKASIDKIKGRGGQVIFVRTPSSGGFLAGENMGYPREKYWEPLLKLTGSQGVHFADYPELDHFDCPEFSHLSQQDAVLFTRTFIKILREEKGWTFQR